MVYTKRIIEASLERYLGHFPAVALIGPRQSGKSTVLQHMLPGYEYITFDRLEQRQAFHDDPNSFMTRHEGNVIFDEAQKVPEIFDAVKIVIDNERDRKGRFLLTGSSQFQLNQNISESLAGRIGLLTLLPFQYAEMPKSLQKESIFRGAYPELVNAGYAHAEDWYHAYMDTYLNKDLKELSQIGNLRDFQRLIQMMAAHVAQDLNYSTYANALGVSVKTIIHWVSILEASYIIFLLPPYYKNYGKRIVKSPKVYFYDTGLVSHLTGIRNEELYEKGPLSGQLFENYVVAEVLKKLKHTQQFSEIFYYRTSNGTEVDLIVDHKTSRDLIEIKKSSTLTPSMTKGIKSILEEGDKGLVLYQGAHENYSKEITAMHFSEYLE